MNISQAAKLTGLSAKQIRDYEKRGLLKAGTRTLSGYRYYEETISPVCVLSATHETWAFPCNKSPNYLNYKTTRIATAVK